MNNEIITSSKYPLIWVGIFSTPTDRKIVNTSSRIKTETAQNISTQGVKYTLDFLVACALNN